MRRSSVNTWCLMPLEKILINTEEFITHFYSNIRSFSFKLSEQTMSSNWIIYKCTNLHFNNSKWNNFEVRQFTQPDGPLIILFAFDFLKLILLLLYNSRSTFFSGMQSTEHRVHCCNCYFYGAWDQGIHFCYTVQSLVPFSNLGSWVSSHVLGFGNDTLFTLVAPRLLTPPG